MVLPIILVLIGIGMWILDGAITIVIPADTRKVRETIVYLALIGLLFFLVGTTAIFHIIGG